MQGLAEGKRLEDAAGKPYALALISRRSSMHPGMRYIARGLNALASPGNEAEVEQLMWTLPAGESYNLKPGILIVCSINALASPSNDLEVKQLM